ncbi:MAG: hypothetical protein CVV23_16425 [Ignavibacteriae bacterium HGW-Ignavibacteriae-2]|jgi:two-component system chemotaxis response regulator CheY|nr:response regulator [Bacteroidota bacterium]PKL87238.1 MAG: hypothetical protein CVV23_16425 [Ignavibacteriae bacterium HGW-Ignavibacteriae-2]
MKQVLVLEDQNYAQVIIERVLRKEFNMDVTLAENGLIGIEKYLEQKPEIIFLDISMPDMNGLEFLGFLRGNLDDKTTPVVVLTANGNKDLVYQLLKMGITSYVLKPFTYETLKEKISEILSSMNVKGSE